VCNIFVNVRVFYIEWWFPQAVEQEIISFYLENKIVLSGEEKEDTKGVIMQITSYDTAVDQRAFVLTPEILGAQNFAKMKTNT
jgi:hypothetical protein